MPMQPLLLAGLETAINRYLQLDPFSTERLQPLHDKVVAVEIRDWSLCLFFVFSGHQIDLLAEYAGQPDGRLSGRSRDLFNLKQQGGGLFKGEITLSGDLTAIQSFQALFEQMDIDWEWHLSKWVGELAAHQMVRGARHLFSFVQASLGSAQSDVMEFLQEEKQVLPSRQQYQAFEASVQEITQQTNQLQLRLQRLEQRLQSR